MKQCIQFYYLWKKVCPDEYKRLRLIRRRKEQESLYYNLRSKEESQEIEEKPPKRNASPNNAVNRRNIPEVYYFPYFETYERFFFMCKYAYLNFLVSKIKKVKSPY